MFDLRTALLTLPAIIIGFTVHEFMHAWTANWLGDSTARDEGRITLNPLTHISWMGMFLIMVAGFGWAKPVAFTRSRLMKPRRDVILISIAGPLANLLVGIICFLLIRLVHLSVPQLGPGVFRLIYPLLVVCGYVNFGLFVFNMLPIPPLDGSHVLFEAVRIDPHTREIMQRYGIFFLLGLIIAGNYTGVDFLPVRGIVNFLVNIFS